MQKLKKRWQFCLSAFFQVSSSFLTPPHSFTWAFFLLKGKLTAIVSFLDCLCLSAVFLSHLFVLIIIIKHVEFDLEGMKMMQWLQLKKLPTPDIDWILRLQLLTGHILPMFSGVRLVLPSQLWLLQALLDQAQEELWQGRAISWLFPEECWWNLEFAAMQTCFLC